MFGDFIHKWKVMKFGTAKFSDSSLFLRATFRYYLSRTSIGIKLTQALRQSLDESYFTEMLYPNYARMLKMASLNSRTSSSTSFFHCALLSPALLMLDEDDGNDDSASDGSQIADVPNEQGGVDEEFYC